MLLEEWANGDEPLGLPDVVMSGFVRIMNSRRVFREPTRPAEAGAAVDAVLRAPASTVLRAGSRHWDLFRQLATDIDAHGNDVPAAYLAAYAIENNATFLSADRGFAGFSRLRWPHPLHALSGS